MTTVFVGNLSPEVTDGDLREAFGLHGKVRSIRLVSRRGFAYVEMKPEAAAAAVAALKGAQLKGRALDVVLETGPAGRPGGRRGRGGFRRRR